MGLMLTFGLGAALIVAGVALVSIPVALIVTGLFVLLFAALFIVDF